MIGTIRLEIIVEAPDQLRACHAADAVQVGECVQLVHQPFRMDPTAMHAADVELTRIIADNHLAQQQPMRVDAAPWHPLR